MDSPLPLSPPRTVILTPPQTQPYSPQVKHPLLDLSNNSYNSSVPLGLQGPSGAAVHRGRSVKDQCYQEPGLPLESNGDGKDCCHSLSLLITSDKAHTLHPPLPSTYGSLRAAAGVQEVGEHGTLRYAGKLQSTARGWAVWEFDSVN